MKIRFIIYIGMAIVFLTSGFLYGFLEILPWLFWAGALVLIAEVGIQIKRRQ